MKNLIWLIIPVGVIVMAGAVRYAVGDAAVVVWIAIAGSYAVVVGLKARAAGRQKLQKPVVERSES